MKKVYILACIVVASVSFVSCTADEETSDNKSATEVKKEVTPATPSYASEEGPGDDPIKVPPPPVR